MVAVAVVQRRGRGWTGTHLYAAEVKFLSHSFFFFCFFIFFGSRAIESIAAHSNKCISRLIVHSLLLYNLNFLFIHLS